MPNHINNWVLFHIYFVLLYIVTWWESRLISWMCVKSLHNLPVKNQQNTSNGIWKRYYPLLSIKVIYADWWVTSKSIQSCSYIIGALSLFFLFLFKTSVHNSFYTCRGQIIFESALVHFVRAWRYYRPQWPSIVLGSLLIQTTVL